MLTLAVLLPVKNEAAHLERTLRSLTAQSHPAERLLVIDGGSKDETSVVARQAGAAFQHHLDGGRGGQIAAGMARIQEDLVLIGHGDMRFPPRALARIREYMAAQQDCPGGCLGHRFASSRWRYRLLEWWDRRRGRRGCSYGDQAQFFRRQVLEQAGGFPDQPIMEDVELMRRLRHHGPLAYLDLPVTVSPRRFESRGWWRVVWENWQFRRAYRRQGVDACQMIFDRYYARR